MMLNTSRTSISLFPYKNFNRNDRYNLISLIKMENYKINFNIDRGGTFTDIYCEWYTDKRECQVYKLLSQDPKNYADAPSEGIRRILNQITGLNIAKGDIIPTTNIESIRMGTTLATNALLERKGERCALLITEGFSDLLEIGNQSRSNIFDLRILKPEKIYECVYEVEERVRILKDKKEALSGSVAQGSTGEFVEILKPLNEDQIRQHLEDIKSKGIKSIAVAFTHSYTFRDHEIRVKEIAKEYGYFENISISHEIMPMVKFYPRGSTAVVDAYLTPAIYSYVQRFMSYFDKDIHTKNVLFMQSDGGLTNHETFFGSKAIISGPAGGVVGYSKTTAKEINDTPIIGLDMGGTSTDVSRYDNGWEHVFEIQISGIAINAPQIDVNTVAAGGGSRLFFKNGMFVVGPESAGAEPGPLCYKKGGYLAVTDANLLLGRLIPEYFPKIFGKGADEELSVSEAMRGMEEIMNIINNTNKTTMSIEEVAMGFIKVANEAMCRPILSLTQARGYDPKDHVLSIFGGAGGQHACALAKILNIKKVYIHKYAGILSAYGLSKAEVVEEVQEPVNRTYGTEALEYCNDLFNNIEKQAKEKLMKLYNQNYKFSTTRYLLMKYSGTDYNLVVQEGESYINDFEKAFKREYGFLLEHRELLLDYARVRVSLVPIEDSDLNISDNEKYEIEATSQLKHSVNFELDGKISKIETDVYFWEQLAARTKINGPALILSGNSTIVIEPDCSGVITSLGNLILTIPQTKPKSTDGKIQKDPLELSLFANRFMGIAEQMGRHLQRTSVSVNIKERLDFSCAIFDSDGNLVANAPHLPVHLGAMQEVVKHQKNYLGSNWKKGEVILCNHPQAGGSHLPDLTVITPVYFGDTLVFYVGNRGHHSDIGGLTSGSMPPFSKKLDDEGAAVYSFKLVEEGKFQEGGVVNIFKDDLIKKGVHPSRNLSDNISDLKAQVAANHKGVELINELIEKFGSQKILAYMKFIQEAAEDSVRDMLDSFGKQIGIDEGKNGTVYSDDFMDDGSKICLNITIDRKDRSAIFDFAGTSPQVYGNINTPRSVTYSAIIYCLRCLVNTDIPLNQGCLNPIQVLIPKDSLLWPSESCAVVGGNVTTSQRITDIILKAFNACAAAQGDMNNFTFGNENFGYYETIGGGSGAGPTWNGTSGVQVHMTNTRITDVEIIERRFPLIITKFSYRKGSGGKGKYHGGDGIIRSFKFYEPLVANILSERRVFEPFGLHGGGNGQRGVNFYTSTDGQTYNIGGKNTITVSVGDSITIMTPGGGGYGVPDGEEHGTLVDKTMMPKENTGSLAILTREQYSN
jgi:5-oxoprolinase (ATP-hydrolysing)